MSSVGLLRCRQYDVESITGIIDAIASSMGSFGELRGGRVLLKPNLLSGRGSALSCSNPIFVTAVAQWFLMQGAKVVVGDSPAFGSAKSVSKARGLWGEMKRIGVPIINFNTPRSVELPCGRTITVAREAAECDYFVGLPRIKAHNQMYTTMAVKNIYGIVKGAHKAMVHMTCENSHQNFSEIILGLAAFLPNQFHFVDGIEVMSHSGPMDGQLLTLGCIAGGSSAVAVDTALLDVLELDPGRNPLTVAARNAGIPGSLSAQLSFPFLAPGDFHGSGFVAPNQLNSVRFNPFRFARGMLRRIGLVQDS